MSDEFPFEKYKQHLINGGAPFGKFNNTINEAIEAYQEIILDLQKSLLEAANDLGKAANQFASMRESQKYGHYPPISNNPEIFEDKANRARLSAWGDDAGWK
jgi:hypothetical protein